MPTQNDIDRLKNFLWSAQQVLGSILALRDVLLPRDLRAPALNAWPGVERAFALLRDEVAQASQQQSQLLDDVGLSGPQLGFKLAGFERAKAKADLELQKPKPKIPGWIKRVLRWINIILGSLAKVFLNADMIREFKEAIEESVDEEMSAA